MRLLFLFQAVRKAGWRAALLNAYPPAYFGAIASGRRLYSAIPLAVTGAGLHNLADVAPAILRLLEV